MPLTGIQQEVQNLFRAARQSSLSGGGGVSISGANLTVRNVKDLEKGIVMECAMQSRAGADAILKQAKVYCPTDTGTLSSTGTVRASDVLEGPSIPGVNVEVSVSGSSFSFTQKQRSVWWVTFGDDTVEYAAAIHENEGKRFDIKTEKNPSARDHYLYHSYLEYEPYFSKRVIDRLQAQVLKAGAVGAMIESVVRRGLGAGTGLPRLVKAGAK
jgi:hypothetical protein